MRNEDARSVEVQTALSFVMPTDQYGSLVVLQWLLVLVAQTLKINLVRRVFGDATWLGLAWLGRLNDALSLSQACKLAQRSGMEVACPSFHL